MDMTETQKQKLLGILVIACLLVILLGVSLSGLQMQPGEIFYPSISNQTTAGNYGVSPTRWIQVTVQGLQVFLLIFLPIYILISLLNKAGRRRLLADILMVTLALLILRWLAERVAQSTGSSEAVGLQLGVGDMTMISEDMPAPPVFEANPQSWMLPLIIFVVAALVAVITFFVSKSMARRKAVDRSRLRDFADNAQTALDDIKEARIEFDDVIIRCYAEMNRALQAEKGIYRAQAMTPYEFGQELLAKGFPARPVEQLTQLFEQVRYGHQQPGENKKRVAIQCLGDIISFCRGQI